MKFTLISDVHVDINPWDWRLLDNCDPSIPMVVAGDIDNDVRATCRWILQLRQRFPRVIWVAGNHDFYNLGFHQTRLVGDPAFEALWPSPKTVPEIVDHYRRWSQAHDIHFLHRSSVTMDGVEFVGTTGWHDFVAGEPISFEDQIQAWNRGIRDSRVIDWAVSFPEVPWQRMMHEARLEADALSHMVMNNDLPKVVVTHHIPQRSFVMKKPDPGWNALNGSFCNTLLETVQDPSIRVWCFGHTHMTWDHDLGGVRYVCNPRGYPNEVPNWQPREIEVV